MAAGPQPAVVRQAVCARLAAVTGVGLAPRRGRAAAAPSRPCNRANSGNIPSSIRTDHWPDLDRIELDPVCGPVRYKKCTIRYGMYRRRQRPGGQPAVEYWTTRDTVGTAAPDPGLRWPELVSAYASSRDNDVPPPRDRSSIVMTSGHQTRYRVVGGNPLQGTVFVQGAKNAALKMIAASLLAEKGRTVLRNVPVIEDVRRAVELAQAVGAKVKFHEVERTLVVDASELTSPILPADITRQFRGSVLFVPALLHRLCEAVLEEVGGCNLGSRNLDLHYRGFVRLGATGDEGESQIHVKADGLRGAHL